MKPDRRQGSRPFRSISRADAGRLAAVLLFCGGCSPSPDPPLVPTESANLELRQRMEEARQAVLANPKSGMAWGRLGQSFEAAEFFREARVCYAEASAKDPTSPRWPHLSGLLQLQDDPEAAFAQLVRAATLSGPTNDASRLRLAQALVEHGRYADATNHLAALMIVRPEHPGARLELARVRLAEGRAAEAADLLTPCLTNPYTARPAAMLLSQSRARTGDAASAAALAAKAAGMPRPFDWPDPFLREVQELRQDRVRTAERLNGLLIQRRFEQAEALLQPLLGRNPDDPEVLLLLGRLRLQQGRCTEAETALRRHLVAQPDSLNGLIQLGLALMCQSRWEEAGETFGQAADVKPDFAQAHFNRGVARSRAGDSVGAVASWREALRCSPGDARTHQLLADELARQGQEAEAAQHRERASRLQ